MSARGVLTLAGTVAGSAFGPVGAAVGGMIGGAIGGAIDGPVHSSQQILDDLGALKLDYGSTWPRIYGRYRFKASPIWSSEKRPIAHDTETDAKGGPSAVSTSYTYEQDWLCWAPLNAKGWARIWRNGELVASRLADADADTLEATASTSAWASVTFFDGAADQMPWSVYEAAVGTPNASAYRHRPTMAFESLDLGNSGQPPLIEVEFVGGPESVADLGAEQYADNVAETDYLDGLRPYGSVVFGEMTTIPTIRDGDVVTIPVDSEGVAGAPASTDAIPDGAKQSEPGRGVGNRALCVFGMHDDIPSGFAVAGDGVSFSAELPEEDNYLGSDAIRFAVWGDSLAVTTSLAIGAAPDSDIEDESSTYAGNQGRIYLYDLASESHDLTIEAGLSVSSVAMNASSVWALSGSTVHAFDASSGAAGSTFSAPPGAWYLLVSASGVLHCISAAGAVSRRDSGEWTALGVLDSVMVSDSVHGIVGGIAYACKGDDALVEDGGYYAVRSFDHPDRASLQAAVQDYADYWFNSFTHGSSGGKRAVTGATIEVIQTSPTTWTASYSCSRLYGYPGDTDGNFDDPIDIWFWASASTSVIIDFEPGDVTKLYHDLYRQPLADVVDPETVDLADIVKAEALLEWSGEDGALTAADIDVSELEGTMVTGYATTGSPREAIASLADVYYFQAVCSDKLYFRFRGGASAATIPFRDTGAGVGQAAAPFCGLVRGNDLEVASQVAFTAPGLLRDYEPDTQNSDRLIGESFELRQYQSPVVFSQTEAKGRADTMVYDGRVAAHAGKLSLDDAYLALEPTDVVTATDDEGNTYRVRVERETFADGVRTFEVSLDDSTVLLSSGITAETDQRAITIAIPPDSDLVPLDIPPLRDADAATPGPYIAVSGSGRWPGGVAYRSTAETSGYVRLATLTSSAVVGATTDALADGVSSALFDTAGILTVEVGGGTLSSATRDAVLDNGANALAVVKADGAVEIVQFVTATLIGSGVYELSNLRRGQFGTEHAMTGHAAGETVVLLTPAGITRAVENLADVGAERFYKAVTIGRTLDSAAAEAFTDTGVVLKPFAAVNVRRDASDPLTIRWDRRTRLSASLPRTTTEIPLGESSESYDVELRDGSNALIDSATVTSAEWTLDPGSYSGHTVTVYQNGQLGRGYPASLTL